MQIPAIFIYVEFVGSKWRAVKAIIARKVGMTRVIDNQKMVAATVLLAEPCVVTQVKTKEQDGYSAVQLGSGQLKNVKKPQLGHLKKSNAKVGRTLVEFRVDDLEQAPKLGEEVSVKSFVVGDVLNVTSQSKGHGFTGTVKRHNFRIGPRGHGGMNQRRPGSIGSTYPQRVIPGKKMAGQMGAARVTVKHLKVLDILPDENLLVLSGSLPGIKGTEVIISGSPRHEAKTESTEKRIANGYFYPKEN